MYLATNRLIPLATGGMILLAGVVGLRACDSDHPDALTLSEIPVPPPADADSPAETIRTLTATVSGLNDRLSALSAENVRLQRQDRELRASIAAQVKAEVEAERQRLESQSHSEDTVFEQAYAGLQSRLDELTAQLEQVKATPAPAPTFPAAGEDLPIGLGLDGMPKSMEESEGALVWIQPLERGGATSAATPASDTTARAASKLPAFPTGWLSDGATEGLLDQSALTGNTGSPAGESGTVSGNAVADPGPPPPTPYLTIPRNATLIGATGMTALIGRIPVQGVVQDPVPFKVIVGADNLAANGLTIPALDGIVASGTARGDWTLACVAGQITSLTFVFQDGTVVTHSADEGSGGTRSLGWISDDQGIPCVSGERITNAPSFLAGRIGLIGIQGAAEAYANAQTTTTGNVFGTESRSVTGDTGSYVAGRTLSAGTDEVARWLQERQAQSFDAVFVRPGSRLAIHIDREIPIDHDPTGRKVSYDTAIDTRYSRTLD